MNSIRKALEAEIALLPEFEKGAYLQAIQSSPTTVESESFYNIFLRFENRVAAPAAKRLAQYWTERKASFGERAYLPLFDLSGAGAMTPDDISFLKRGILVQIPNDSKGRSVLVNDASRLSDATASLTQHGQRCSFFAVAKAAFDNHPTNAGTVFLQVVTDSNFCDIDEIQFRYVMSLFAFMPTKLEFFHICCIPPRGSKHFFENSVLPLQEKLIGKELPEPCIKMHMVDDKESMALVMKDNGIDAERLVPSLGGMWSYDAYESAIERQASSPKSEERRSSEYAALARDALESHLAVKHSESSLEADEEAKDDDDAKPISGRQARKRKMDAIYARQRRMREKSEEEDLQKQYSDLRQINMKLEQESLRLERLLAEASAKISLLEGQTNPPDAPIRTTSGPLTDLCQLPFASPVQNHGWGMPARRQAAIQEQQGSSMRRAQSSQTTSGGMGGLGGNLLADDISTSRTGHLNRPSDVASQLPTQSHPLLLDRMFQEFQYRNNVPANSRESLLERLANLHQAVGHNSVALTENNHSLGGLPGQYGGPAISANALSTDALQRQSVIQDFRVGRGTTSALQDTSNPQQLDVETLLRALQNRFLDPPP